MSTETDPIPRDYAAWRHCIEHDCQIPLTQDFITARLEALRNERDEHTRRFLECYGDDHHRQVLSWFERAAESLKT